MSTELETKRFGPLEIKDEERGEVEAIVATLNVVDRDGDVILPGAIQNGVKVKLSDYSHDIVYQGKAPVGKGALFMEGSKVIFRGKFFLTTARGLESFRTVKELGEESEWSFGFPRKVDTMPMTKEWNERGARRLISGMEPVEASPVLIGAGIGTRTTAVKEAKVDPEPPAGDNKELALSVPPTVLNREPIAKGMPLATLLPVKPGNEATHILASKSESLSARMEAVCRAIWMQNDEEGLSWWIREVFDDHVIVQAGNRLLSVAYALDADGAVTLGEAFEVELTYLPVADAATKTAPAAKSTDAEASYEFERLQRNRATFEAFEARRIADAAEAEAKRLEAGIVAKRAVELSEQQAVEAELMRFERTRRRLGTA